MILNEMEKRDMCTVDENVLDYVNTAAVVSAGQVDQQQMLQQQQHVDVNHQHQIELMAHERML